MLANEKRRTEGRKEGGRKGMKEEKRKEKRIGGSMVARGGLMESWFAKPPGSKMRSSVLIAREKGSAL